jgi:hypothetical protein
MVLVERSRALRASQQPGKPNRRATLRVGASPMKHRLLKSRHRRFRRRRWTMSRRRCRQRAVKAPSCAALPPILPVSSQAHS